MLGVEISKQQQSSDWGADKLSREQQEYAANDVFFLHELKTRLDVMLERHDRMHLAQACFDFLPARAALDLAGWPDIDLLSHS
jgi:ribonuclease D